MDTGPSEPGSTSPEPPRSSRTSDTTRSIKNATTVSHEPWRGHNQSEGIFTEGLASPDITDDDRSYTAGCMSTSSLTLLGSGDLDELGGKHKLLADDDFAKLFPENDQALHSVELPKASVGPPNIKSYLSNTALEHHSLSDDSEDDSRSVQSFWTARVTIGTYVTAQSVVPDYKRWRDRIFERGPNDNYTIYERKAHEHIQTVFRDELTLESLASAIVSTLEIDTCQKASPSIQAAVWGGLTPLRNHSAISMSMNELNFGWISTVEKICSSSNVTFDQQFFADRTEQFIWEYAVKWPALEEFVRKSLSTCKTFGSQWLKLLGTHGLILSPEEALDWSGRGQHVQYSPDEEASIPLVFQGTLGFGASGLVDRVRCRRIGLARKTIQCIRNLTREEAAREVAHLQHLQHRHIVRLVGTYTLRKKLSILTYPATEYNLAEFLDHAYDKLTSPILPVSQSLSQYSWFLTLSRIMGCLANALKFIHGQSTKHMDIKPTNILVDYSQTKDTTRVYITDFGISRSYQSMEASFTDSPISYTRIYAAPEVTQQITRGPPADIFSLGCVFMEIMATMLSTPKDSEQERLPQIRNESPDISYQANIEKIIEWYEMKKGTEANFLLNWGTLFPQRMGLANLLPSMPAVSPEARPTAAELWDCAKNIACKACESGPEPFKAA